MWRVSGMNRSDTFNQINSDSRTAHPLRILQVASHDIAGGAARIAWLLYAKLKERGYISHLAGGRKQSDDDSILQIDNNILFDLRHNITRRKSCMPPAIRIKR